MSVEKAFCLQNAIHSLIDRFSASSKADEGGGDGLLRRVGQAAVILVKHSTQHFLHYYTLKVLISWLYLQVTGIALESTLISLWQNLCITYCQNPLIFFVVVSFLVNNVVYWVWGSFFVLLDHTGWLSQYKVQPETNQPPNRTHFLATVKQVFFNQLLFMPPFVTVGFFALQLVGPKLDLARFTQVPSFERMILEFVAHDIIFEFAFFFSHRTLHHRWFYKRFHKQHHEWRAPLAVAAAYAHPVEYITCNMWSVSIGPLLLGSHPLVLWAWTVYLNYRTILLHSDYALPGFQKPNFHDFHHIRFNQNFGSCGAMDRIYQTDTVFRKANDKEKSL